MPTHLTRAAARRTASQRTRQRGEGASLGANQCQPQPTAKGRLGGFLRFPLSVTKRLCVHIMDVGGCERSFFPPKKNPICAQPRRGRAARATLSSSRSPSPIEAAGSRRGAQGRPVGHGFEPRCAAQDRPARPDPRASPPTRPCLPMLRLWRGERGPARGLFCAPASGAPGRRLHPPAARAPPLLSPGPRRGPGRRERAASARAHGAHSPAGSLPHTPPHPRAGVASGRR